jgi:hypothetical protein
LRQACVKAYAQDGFQFLTAWSAGVSAYLFDAVPPGTLLAIELEISNLDGALFPGKYAQVKSTCRKQKPDNHYSLERLYLRSEGTQVAIVDEHNRIHWQTIQVGRDFGT